jgi:hypothetical protein
MVKNKKLLLATWVAPNNSFKYFKEETIKKYAKEFG